MSSKISLMYVLYGENIFIFCENNSVLFTNSFALNLWYKRICHKETSKQNKRLFCIYILRTKLPLLARLWTLYQRTWKSGKNSEPQMDTYIYMCVCVSVCVCVCVCVCVSLLLGKDKLRITNNLFMTCVS